MAAVICQESQAVEKEMMVKKWFFVKQMVLQSARSHQKQKLSWNNVLQKAWSEISVKKELNMQVHQVQMNSNLFKKKLTKEKIRDWQKQILKKN